MSESNVQSLLNFRSVIQKKKGKARQSAVTKQEKALEKALQNDDVVIDDPDYPPCPYCGESVSGENEDSKGIISTKWVGCDICDRWCHAACAGFTVPPKKEEKFVCKLCFSIFAEVILQQEIDLLKKNYPEHTLTKKDIEIKTPESIPRPNVQKNPVQNLKNAAAEKLLEQMRSYSSFANKFEAQRLINDAYSTLACKYANMETTS